MSAEEEGRKVGEVEGGGRGVPDSARRRRCSGGGEFRWRGVGRERPDAGPESRLLVRCFILLNIKKCRRRPSVLHSEATLDLESKLEMHEQRRVCGG